LHQVPPEKGKYTTCTGRAASGDSAPAHVRFIGI
jgi:hypothetical protein